MINHLLFAAFSALLMNGENKGGVRRQGFCSSIEPFPFTPRVKFCPSSEDFQILSFNALNDGTLVKYHQNQGTYFLIQSRHLT